MQISKLQELCRSYEGEDLYWEISLGEDDKDWMAFDAFVSVVGLENTHEILSNFPYCHPMVVTGSNSSVIYDLISDLLEFGMPMPDTMKKISETF